MMKNIIKEQVKTFMLENSDFLISEIGNVSDPILKAFYQRGIKCPEIRSHIENLVIHITSSSSEQLAEAFVKSDKFSSLIEGLIDKKINNILKLNKDNSNEIQQP